MLIVEYFGDWMTGLWTTTYISFVSFAIGVVISVFGALARLSPIRVLRAIASIYVEVIRNVPALVVLFFVFYGLPALSIHLPAVMAGTIALSLHAGAYMTEVLRAGFVAVPSSQREAARTLGLSSGDTFIHVVLPQAVRIVYPSVVTEFLQLILASSLLSVIAVTEITGTALIINGLTFRTMEAFATALVLYLLLSNAVSFGLSGLGRLLFPAPGVSEKQNPKLRSPRARQRSAIKEAS